MIADEDAARMLKDTPYLIEGDAQTREAFLRTLQKAGELAEKARRAGEQIRTAADEIFETFGITLRSEIIAESNQMEHLLWTPQEVRQVVAKNRDLLEMPVHSFLKGIESDSHAFEALGLYKAQMIADDWALAGERPREIEIKQLHGLITHGESFAGAYKTVANSIAGAEHQPPHPAESAEGMRELARWMQTGTGDPVLDATVVHAWITHLHPFDDGNGRMARLLANLVLSQGGYPPLIVSATSDRGEYYDALAASDRGDILPLFELFFRTIRRTVKDMSSKDYVERVIQERVLVSESQQHKIWQKMAQSFSDTLRDALRVKGWSTIPQGLPSPGSFRELAARERDGNSWFLKVSDDEGRARWLLWFGFNSESYREIYGTFSGYPSIFLSQRDERECATHPYTPVHGEGAHGAVSQVVIRPGHRPPAAVQTGYSWSDYSVDDAAALLGETLTGDFTGGLNLGIG